MSTLCMDQLGTAGLRPCAPLKRRRGFEGTAKGSNAGVGSLGMELHGFMRGDRTVTGRGRVGGRAVR